MATGLCVHRHFYALSTRSLPKMGQNHETDKLLSLKTISERYEVSVKYLRSQIASGALPALKLGTRTSGTLKDVRPIRVRESDLAEWAEPIRNARW